MRHQCGDRIYLFFISQRTWSQLTSLSWRVCSNQSQNSYLYGLWVWLMSCYYLFNIKYSELCDVLSSFLTVWKIHRWLMVYCLSRDILTRSHVTGTDMIRLLEVMYHLLWGQENQLYLASLGEFLESESAWQLWWQLVLLRIYILNWSHNLFHARPDEKLNFNNYYEEKFVCYV